MVKETFLYYYYCYICSCFPCFDLQVLNKSSLTIKIKKMKNKKESYQIIRLLLRIMLQ